MLPVIFESPTFPSPALRIMGMRFRLRIPNSSLQSRLGYMYARVGNSSVHVVIHQCITEILSTHIYVGIQKPLELDRYP